MATPDGDDDNPFAHVNDPPLPPEPNVPSTDIEPEANTANSATAATATAADGPGDVPPPPEDDGLGMSEEQTTAYEAALPPTAVDFDATRRPRAHVFRPVEHSIGPQPEGTNVWAEQPEVLKVSGIPVQTEEAQTSAPPQDVFTPSSEQRS